MVCSNVVVRLFLAAVIAKFCVGNGEDADKCINGRYHKERPSPEGPDYVECQPWKEKACCTAEFTALLKNSTVEVLYNFSWHHCGNLSKDCEQYIKHEECFYSCEPSLIKWYTSKGGVKGVPICADYCDRWFDACKNDTTCAEDWLTDFNDTSGQYTCRTNSKCLNFSELYKDGKGLCNKMWGHWYEYETSDNCMVMWFAGENPNEKVKAAAVTHNQFKLIHTAFVLSLIKLPC